MTPEPFAEADLAAWRGSDPATFHARAIATVDELRADLKSATSSYRFANDCLNRLDLAKAVVERERNAWMYALIAVVGEHNAHLKFTEAMQVLADMRAVTSQ